jgi:hypothetical protein
MTSTPILETFRTQNTKENQVTKNAQSQFPTTSTPTSSILFQSNLSRLVSFQSSENALKKKNKKMAQSVLKKNFMSEKAKEQRNIFSTFQQKQRQGTKQNLSNEILALTNRKQNEKNTKEDIMLQLYRNSNEMDVSKPPMETTTNEFEVIDLTQEGNQLNFISDLFNKNKAESTSKQSANTCDTSKIVINAKSPENANFGKSKEENKRLESQFCENIQTSLSELTNQLNKLQSLSELTNKLNKLQKDASTSEDVNDKSCESSSVNKKANVPFSLDDTQCKLKNVASQNDQTQKNVGANSSKLSLHDDCEYTIVVPNTQFVADTQPQNYDELIYKASTPAQITDTQPQNYDELISKASTPAQITTKRPTNLMADQSIIDKNPDKLRHLDNVSFDDINTSLDEQFINIKRNIFPSTQTQEKNDQLPKIVDTPPKSVLDNQTQESTTNFTKKRDLDQFLSKDENKSANESIIEQPAKRISNEFVEPTLPAAVTKPRRDLVLMCKPKKKKCVTSSNSFNLENFMKNEFKKMQKSESKASPTVQEELNENKKLTLVSKNKVNPKHDVMRQMMLKHSSECDEN